MRLQHTGKKLGLTEQIFREFWVPAVHIHPRGRTQRTLSDGEEAEEKENPPHVLSMWHPQEHQGVS